jgi:hypothetical protein
MIRMNSQIPSALNLLRTLVARKRSGKFPHYPTRQISKSGQI